MAAGSNAPARSGKFFSVAGVLMVLCCVAGPAVVGAAAGAAIGNVLGVAAAVVVALAFVMVLRHWRGNDKAC
jgi:hypothetical protein